MSGAASVVWYQLYVGTETMGSRSKITFKSDVADIEDLRGKIKENRPNALRNYDVPDLIVYQSNHEGSYDKSSPLDLETLISNLTSVYVVVIAPPAAAAAAADASAARELKIINKKFEPLFQVLPDLLREVNLIRTSRLNPWEKESARTTGSQRSSDFRQNVINYYGRATQSGKNVKCQVLDELTPTAVAQKKIIASHIWKASTRGKGLTDFGLEASAVNSPRNGLFLTKGIEEAFDKQQVCFVYNKLHSCLILWVADVAIMPETIIGSTSMFSDVHEKPLLSKYNHLPFRRLLAWHARLTLQLHKKSLEGLNYTSQYDTSPGREKRDPISLAIDAMVEPGEDASVESN